MRLALLLAVLALAAAPARACLWDYDTLVEEQRGLPSLEDAILGRYEVHTREYYERRRDRLEARAKAEGLSEDEHDDLAVAHERLGDAERAIALMHEKEARWPGRYTTAANLGTFLVHAGRLEEGLAHLERAIEINPDAHFGRERYQVAAVKFVIAAKADPAHAHSHTILGPTMEVALGFDLTGEHASLPHPTVSQLQRRYPGLREDVYSGLVGMLKLGGDPRAPWHEFYYALGELLACGGWDTVWAGKERLPDARRLAWMAFERAREAGSPRGDAITRYQQVLAKYDAPPKDEHLAGRRRAAAWVDAYQAFERDLLARDEDASDPARFEPFYAEHGRPDRLVYPRRARATDVAHWFSSPNAPAYVASALIALVTALYVWLRVRAGRRARAA
ncbi:MAG: hypothetical protein M9894_04110 [Planctomycetes bacterium]|nr:hypothetical protein [Planctomycetota bacterium]